jgi:hypothetical protein
MAIGEAEGQTGPNNVMRLRIKNTELDVGQSLVSLLLIGIVKNNTIMVIDFALNAECVEGKMMAATFSAVSPASGTGIVSELRRLLGFQLPADC